LLSLGGGKISPLYVRRRRARDVRCRHLRPWGLRSCNLWPCDLRPCDLRGRGARCCNVRRGARCSLRGCRPCGRSGGSCRCRLRRSLRARLSPGILCGSRHRNGDGQCGSQRHPSSQIQHCSSSTSAELRFRHSNWLNGREFINPAADHWDVIEDEQDLMIFGSVCRSSRYRLKAPARRRSISSVLG
jgi:hypothetical protein